MARYRIAEDYKDTLRKLCDPEKWSQNIKMITEKISKPACKLETITEFYKLVCDKRYIVLIEIFALEIVKRKIDAMKLSPPILEFLRGNRENTAAAKHTPSVSDVAEHTPSKTDVAIEEICKSMSADEINQEIISMKLAKYVDDYDVAMMEVRMELDSILISSAIKSGDTEYCKMVHEMLGKQMDIDEGTLSLASKSGSAEMLLKIDNEKRITLVDLRQKNCYMLMSVCQNGHFDVLKMFVDRFGVDNSPVVWNPVPDDNSLIINTQIEVRGVKKTIGEMILPKNPDKPLVRKIWFRKFVDGQYKSWEEDKKFFDFDEDYSTGIAEYRKLSEKRTIETLKNIKAPAAKLTKFDIGANNFYALNRICESGRDDMLKYIAETFAFVKEDLCNKTDLATFPPSDIMREKIEAEKKSAVDEKREPKKIEDERTFIQFYMLCDIMMYVRKFSTLKILLDLPRLNDAAETGTQKNRKARRAKMFSEVITATSTENDKLENVVIIITSANGKEEWNNRIKNININPNLAATLLGKPGVNVIFATNYITSVLTENVVKNVKQVIMDSAIGQTNRQIAVRHLAAIWRVRIGYYEYVKTGVVDVINKTYGEF